MRTASLTIVVASVVSLLGLASCRLESGPGPESSGEIFLSLTGTYDHDSNPTTPNVPVPRCTALSSSDTDGNGLPDYLEWGCGPLG